MFYHDVYAVLKYGAEFPMQPNAGENIYIYSWKNLNRALQYITIIAAFV